jgi:MYXO-CTERM domain-containing protein
MMSQDTPRQGAAGDRDELVAGIEQDRQDLAKTVQALAAKADVPARVRDKASQVRDQLSTLNTTAREKAPQMREQVAASLTKAGQSIPEPARRTAVRTTRQATDAAAKQPAALYAAAGVCAAAGLWLWRRRRS